MGKLLNFIEKGHRASNQEVSGSGARCIQFVQLVGRGKFRETFCPSLLKCDDQVRTGCAALFASAVEIVV